jgi:HSP20 family protein
MFCGIMGFFNKLKGGIQTENQKEPSSAKASEDKEVKTLEKEVKNKKEENFAELMETEGELAVDVYQTESDIVVQSTIAGVKPEDLDISVENDVLTIRGERKDETKEEGKNYFYQECYWGAFSRQIILPEEVDPNRIEATMKNGILTIKLPKINRSKLRKIAIKTGEKKNNRKEEEE